MSEILIDSYSESNYSTPTNIANRTRGQCFSNANKIKISSCKFYLKKIGSPGNPVAYLYAMSGTYGTTGIPTGTVLATSNEVDASTISSVTRQLITFTFPEAQKYEMQANTKYCILMGVSGGDASNTYEMGYDATEPGHDGNFTDLDGTYQSTRDIIFYVYGESIATLNKKKVRIKTSLGLGL